MSENKRLGKEQFCEAYAMLMNNKLGPADHRTKIDFNDAYDTFKDLLEQMDKDTESILHMMRMREMTTEERLRWRMCLAEEGIEMTPRQVDEYIVLLDMALNQD